MCHLSNHTSIKLTHGLIISFRLSPTCFVVPRMNTTYFQGFPHQEKVLASAARPGLDELRQFYSSSILLITSIY